MKIRSNYVSNSSSSSYVIYNWNNISDDKKQKILEYQVHAIEEWKKLGVKLIVEKGWVHPDYRKGYSEQDIDADGKIDIDSKYDFGWVEKDICWRFRENKEKGILEMTTSMDNFDMEAWMDYLGEINYCYTGENWGYFPDEEIQITPIDELKKIFEGKKEN